MPKLNNCPCTGKTLDRLVQPAVLVILAEESLHGYRIVDRIGEMTSFFSQTPDASGVYRTLKSMEQKELILGSWDISEGGPAKKCYQITTKGRQCLERWIKTLEDYRKSINGLLQAARKAIR